ncbi:hypothetical protein FRC08_000927 [Ceratobasidium sp. 394]|nr:hypothetical protein FRC08_000927 [Ceratobasidium sp. 394]
MSNDSDTPSDKGKNTRKNKKKKKSKRTRVPELGVKLDKLQCPKKQAEERRVCHRSSGQFDQLRADQTPLGFKTGGYLKMKHGDVSRRECSHTPDCQERAERERSTRNSEAGSVWTDKSHCPMCEDPSEPSDDLDDGTYHDKSNSDSQSDSDSSSDSSDLSSSSSSDDEARKLKWHFKHMKSKQKQLEKKLVAQAQSRYKAQAPKTYNGDVDFDKFELFVFNYDNWCKDTKLSSHMCV